MQVTPQFVQPDTIVGRMNEDHFDAIKRTVKRAGVTNPGVAQVLSRNIAATISAYRVGMAKSGEAMSFREKHDRLRALHRLTERPDPPIGQIRARLKELPPKLLADIEDRAEGCWPSYFGEPAPTSSALGWLPDLPADKLVAILLSCISDGGRRVPGRARGSGGVLDRASNP